MRAVAAALAVLTFAVFALLGCGEDPDTNAAGSAEEAADDRPAEESRARPNIVVIMSDDQGMGSFDRSTMPRTIRLLGDRGTRFRHGFAAPPLCCPSRAGFLTGQYPHNHGVVENEYRLLADPESILPAWLSDAGYRTGLVGKYLNKYAAVAGSAPAPGFDFWHAFDDKPGYYDYDVSHNGEVKAYGSQRRDYSTTMATRKARAFIRHSSGPRPFFLWVSYYAPHFRSGEDPHSPCDGFSPKPAPGDYRRFRDSTPPRPRSFDERRIADKPEAIRDLPRLDRVTEREIALDSRCTLAAMRDVDRGVARIVRALRRGGEAGKTALFFTSDNGSFFGEHRIAEGKEKPYEESMRVPFLARVRSAALGARAAKAVGEPVANIDLAPTILELAGADPCVGEDCRELDGRSLVGLLRGERGAWPRDRGLLIELGAECEGYAGVRARRYMYTEYPEPTAGGCEVAFRELYDLERDPYQLRNLLGGRRRERYEETARGLAARLGELRECGGTGVEGGCE